MRTLNRNKQKIWYALYAGNLPLSDEDGNETGEYGPVYGEPHPYSIYITAAKGEREAGPFGGAEDYDRIMVCADPDCPIDEDTLLWVDTPTGGPHDYLVAKAARSLNGISYGIKKVQAGG